MEKIKKILIISSDKNLKEVLNFCFDGWGYEVFLQDEPVANLMLIKRISPDVIIIDVHSAKKEQLEICRLLKEDFATAVIPVITLINKRHLRTQLLNVKQGVDDYLIKPPDPLDLRVRVEMAIRRSQYSFYSSALTGLPGGKIIEEVINTKFKEGIAFSFGYVDIDNFKYFNDVYGYMKGDAVIMQTAYMLYTVIHKFGNSSDFLGHIGGDDFVFITTPDRYEEVCQNFIFIFDSISPFHYSRQDKTQGFVVARDRTHKIKKIALMSVSVAVVNKKDSTAIKNMLEINEKIAEIKKYLKGIEGSKFMADRRDTRYGSLNPQVCRKEEIIGDYKPLGQILLDNRIISSEQLDEALRLHWKRGIVLGEVLMELGYINKAYLEEVLTAQQTQQMEVRR